jgi:hypothetical protein
VLHLDPAQLLLSEIALRRKALSVQLYGAKAELKFENSSYMVYHEN